MALISTLARRASHPNKPLPFWLTISGLLACASALAAFMLYDFFVRSPRRRTRIYSLDIPLRRHAHMDTIPSQTDAHSELEDGPGPWWAPSRAPPRRRTLRRVGAVPVRPLPALPPAAPRLDSLESLPSLSGAGRSAAASLVSIGVNSDAGFGGDDAGYEGSVIEAEGLAEAARAVEDEVRCAGGAV